MAEAAPRPDDRSGHSVVLLHGILGSPENWRSQVEALAAGHRVVALELPIFTFPITDCSVGRLADHVLEQLQQLAIDHAIFVGNSLGGHIALELAMNAPERVRGLVLTGSSGLFERGFEKGVPVRPTREWIEERIASHIFYDPRNIRPEMVDEAVSSLASRTNRRRLVRWAKSAKRAHLGDQLRRVCAPTLLIWGRQDRVTPLAVAREFLTGIPRAQLVLIDRCGHAPMIEHPRCFTRALTAFLGTLSRETPSVPAA